LKAVDIGSIWSKEVTPVAVKVSVNLTTPEILTCLDELKKVRQFNVYFLRIFAHGVYLFNSSSTQTCLNHTELSALYC